MIRLTALSAFAFAVASGPAFGEVSTAELDAISIPDRVETAIGTLEFFDGVPTDTTVGTLYDNLDRMRGMQVFLDNVGAVSMYSVRKGLADAGAEGANRIAIFEQLLDSQTLVVTANTCPIEVHLHAFDPTHRNSSRRDRAQRASPYLARGRLAVGLTHSGIKPRNCS
jgi:hypothetical protein